MGRSGTSAVAGVLYHAGVPMGWSLQAPDSGNPRGYFEDMDLCRLHRVLDHGNVTQKAIARAAYRREIEFRNDTFPVWGVKDPRITDIWRVLLPMYEGCEVKLVIPTRPFPDVLRSFHRTYPESWAGTLRWGIVRRLKLAGLMMAHEHYEVRFAEILSCAGISGLLDYVLKEHRKEALAKGVGFIRNG